MTDTTPAHDVEIRVVPSIVCTNVHYGSPHLDELSEIFETFVGLSLKAGYTVNAQTLPLPGARRMAYVNLSAMRVDTDAPGELPNLMHVATAVITPDGAQVFAGEPSVGKEVMGFLSEASGQEPEGQRVI